MIKMIFCVKRRPDINYDEFYRYWLEDHGPLVRKHTKALKIKKYIQCHTIQDTDEMPLNKIIQDSRGSIDPYDGAAELWWNSIDDLVAATSSPEGAEAGQEVLEDEQKFIDLSRCWIFFTEEHTIVDN